MTQRKKKIDDTRYISVSTAPIPYSIHGLTNEIAMIRSALRNGETLSIAGDQAFAVLSNHGRVDWNAALWVVDTSRKDT